MAKPLNERIASARSTDRVTLTDLRALIAEITGEVGRLNTQLAQAESESVDVLLSQPDQDAAAATADRCRRLAAGYSAVLVDLEAKLESRLEGERQRALQAERDEVLARRDGLVERWREVYPRVTQELIQLFKDTIENDQRLADCRIYEPSAEAIARELSANFSDGASFASRLTATKLMPLVGAERIWPVKFDSAGYADAIGRMSAQAPA